MGRFSGGRRRRRKGVERTGRRILRSERGRRVLLGACAESQITAETLYSSAVGAEGWKRINRTQAGPPGANTRQLNTSDKNPRYER